MLVLKSAICVLLVLMAGCASRPPEATSLLGRPLWSMALDAETRAERDANLREAEAVLAAAPNDELAHIWYGRRLAYLGRYQDAIDAFSRALEQFPSSVRLYRHRGHRYLTVRQIGLAIDDLECAARLAAEMEDAAEPDGLPNRLGIPTSTTIGNIYYHLGLCYYLQGNDEDALGAYDQGWALARNPDMKCAVAYWRALTLFRLGRDDEAAAALAPITPDMEVIENHAYHQLVLLFKGEFTPERVEGGGEGDVRITGATAAYGLGAWYDRHGDPTRAMKIWREITAGPAWPAFGFIAAEAEIARRR